MGRDFGWDLLERCVEPIATPLTQPKRYWLPCLVAAVVLAIGSWSLVPLHIPWFLFSCFTVGFTLAARYPGASIAIVVLPTMVLLWTQLATTLVLFGWIAHSWGRQFGTKVEGLITRGEVTPALTRSVVTLSVAALVAMGLPRLTAGGWIRPGVREPFAAPLIERDGRKVSSDALHGKTTVLYFWASWCPACHLSLPSIEAAAKELSGEKDVVFRVVVEDEDRVGGAEHYATTGGRLPLWFDPDGEGMRQLGLQGIPATLILDGDGNVAVRKAGVALFDNGGSQVVNAVRWVKGSYDPMKGPKEAP